MTKVYKKSWQSFYITKIRTYQKIHLHLLFMQTLFTLIFWKTYMVHKHCQKSRQFSRQVNGWFADVSSKPTYSKRANGMVNQKCIVTVCFRLMVLSGKAVQQPSSHSICCKRFWVAGYPTQSNRLEKRKTIWKPDWTFYNDDTYTNKSSSNKKKHNTMQKPHTRTKCGNLAFRQK